ncbi:STAS domain-containing protein [Alkalispirochaeta americana]|uniref:STAS domain-containing protein n=1 Tax=Alkalispirochaeta americana TaxID=159291 RepID=A0A1N6N704_9SPIO|nr:STAS domain-containing protein [Alkalispirochaeta americana]SIP87839.1 STAS domain-containing protein [Alkalispirochaeta americana]
MAKVEMQDQDGLRTVVVQGGVTIGDVDELYQILGEALDQKEGTLLRVDTRGVTFAELPFVQLLLALVREASARSIPLDLTSAAGAVFEEALHELGCTQFFRPAGEGSSRPGGQREDRT